jgi:hypothetical protein
LRLNTKWLENGLKSRNIFRVLVSAQAEQHLITKLFGMNLKNMKTAKQLLETYLAAISAGEMERAIALFADDGGIEFPYFGSVNLPIRYQGPEALKRFFAPVMDGAENFKFKNIKISKFSLVKTKITSQVNTRWTP